jgi:glycosyltransferase involved in cell wall biosynthesis
MTDKRLDIVMFSTADWTTPYWTNKQHIASRLAARGHRLLYVETVGLRRPTLNKVDVVRVGARLKRGLAPIARVQENLWVLSPLTFPSASRNPAIASFNDWQLRRRIGGWLRKHEVARPLVWTYHPFMLQMAESLDPSALVYHCVDDIGAIPGVDHSAFEFAERRLLERAELIFATSHLLYDRCAAIAGSRAHYFGNVADIDHFATAREDNVMPADLSAIPRPRIGYVGVLSDFKVDFGLLEALIAAHPDWHFVFIGEEREGQRNATIARIRNQPNAHFLGWRPYGDLPRYLSGFEAALLPQLINDYTRAMFPMKFFEYLAAGLSVVSTPLPALRDLAAFHAIADSPAAFAQAISVAISGQGSKAPAIGDSILKANSWDARLDQMMELIEAQPAQK